MVRPPRCRAGRWVGCPHSCRARCRCCAAGVDLDTVSDRMAIRNAVQCGEMQQAIERTNAVDPAILAGDQELSFKLKQQQLVELIRSGGVEEALTFAQAELSPLAEGQPAFLEELERSMLLLAYDDLSQAPTAELLTQAARQKTASLLNAAILGSQKQAQAPMLPMMLRMLQWAQVELQQRQPLPFPQIEDLVEAVPRLRVTDGPTLAHAEQPLPTAGFGAASNPPPPARVSRTPNVLASQPGLGPMAAMAHIVALQDELESSERDNP